MSVFSLSDGLRDEGLFLVLQFKIGYRAQSRLEIFLSIGSSEQKTGIPESDSTASRA